MNAELTRANPTERELLMKLCMIIDLLEKEDWEPIRARLESDPDAFNHLLAAKTYITNAAARVIVTLPPENWAYIDKNARGLEVVFRPRTTVTRDSPWMYVHTEDLNVVLKYAMESECGICLRNEYESRKCPLRAALTELLDEKESPLPCGYRRR